MLGGYQIIDLRSTGLVLSSEKQTITDVKILEQLRSFRDYIEKNHDYAKPLNKALKPVLIRYRDGKTDEELEVSAFALIKNSNASLTYEIITNKLNIEVIFEEKTDDDGNKYYDIKTAKYLYNDNIIVEGDLTVGGDLTVTGAINGEETPSVKPIYFHPILINNTSDDNYNFRISLIILNNDETPFTLNTLLTYLKAPEGARWLVYGSIYDKTNSKYIVPTYLTKSGTTLYIVAIDNSGDNHTSVLNPVSLDTLLNLEGSNLIDLVNKIN